MFAYIDDEEYAYIAYYNEKLKDKFVYQVLFNECGIDPHEQLDYWYEN